MVQIEKRAKRNLPMRSICSCVRLCLNKNKKRNIKNKTKKWKKIPKNILKIKKTVKNFLWTFI